MSNEDRKVANSISMACFASVLSSPIRDTPPNPATVSRTENAAMLDPSVPLDQRSIKSDKKKRKKPAAGTSGGSGGDAGSLNGTAKSKKGSGSGSKAGRPSLGSSKL